MVVVSIENVVVRQVVFMPSTISGRLVTLLVTSNWSESKCKLSNNDLTLKSLSQQYWLGHPRIV